MARVAILFLFATLHAQAVIVATVGDSLADAVYLGLRLQPDLLRKSGIKLVRWSRPKIGLTRTDYFDYTAWLRDTADLGSADFCVVQLGANDLQSIATGDGKWIRVGNRGLAARVRRPRPGPHSDAQTAALRQRGLAVAASLSE